MTRYVEISKLPPELQELALARVRASLLRERQAPQASSAGRLVCGCDEPAEGQEQGRVAKGPGGLVWCVVCSRSTR